MNLSDPATRKKSQKILDSFPLNPVSYFNLFAAPGMARIK